MPKKLEKKDMGKNQPKKDFGEKPTRTGKTSLRPKPVKKHDTIK